MIFGNVYFDILGLFCQVLWWLVKVLCLKDACTLIHICLRVKINASLLEVTGLKQVKYFFMSPHFYTVEVQISVQEILVCLFL